MRWKQLIKEYFVNHSEGTTESIRNWISNTYFDLIKEDVIKWINNVCSKEPHLSEVWQETLGNQNKLNRLTQQKINFSNSQIMFHLKNFVKLGMLRKEDNYSGLSIYKFTKIGGEAKFLP